MNHLYQAPANLLLGGEYRITEEGGRGLAFAIEPHAFLQLAPHETPQIREFYGSLPSYPHWPPEPGTLLDSVIQCLKPPQNLPSFRMDIDTQKFHCSEGTKKGFGSSAVAALLYTQLFAHFTSKTVPENLWEMALKAHRLYQGGGSGYDVLCSFFGGIGQFTGGMQPQWTPLTWPQNLSAWIFFGPKPVKTSSALQAYQHWTQNQQNQASHFRGESDVLMHALSERFMEHDATGIFSLVRELAELGKDLGEKIGVSAHPILPSELTFLHQYGTQSPVALKTLGAGNELCLLLADSEFLPLHQRQKIQHVCESGQGMPLTISMKGLEKIDS
ncbi:MAG: hypothetical protein MI717_03115 [Spirochaetales bacterium]|nr:hypothetical protein [Spirochaetales bacterium]